jgi:aminoglycoside/choline kinase family phosphotransferase
MIAIDEFLERSGFSNAKKSLISGHASSKIYYRLYHAGKSYIVLMCAPGTLVRICTVSKILLDHRIPTPKIIDKDIESGFAIIEDLGEQLLDGTIGTAVTSLCHADYFSVALDILIAIQRIPTHDCALPALSFDEYVLELDTLTDWYFLDANGRHIETRSIIDFFASLESVRQFSAILPPCFVHRDFYPGNLIINPQKPPGLHVIDYEDASIGSPTYDLVSLLQDLRHDVDPTFETIMKEKYRHLRGFSQEEFEIEYATYGALRAMRVLGLWRRLKLRDQKPDYVAYDPYTRQKLQTNFGHPALAGLKRTFLKYFNG